jgi:tripeptide aminopeptidase
LVILSSTNLALRRIIIKINANWKNLLIIAGLSLRKTSHIEEEEYHFSSREIEYLETLLSHMEGRFPGLSVEASLLREPPSSEVWKKAINKSFEGNNEGGGYGISLLTNIEFPMQALVTNFNRLGLATIGSCCGHGCDSRLPFQRHPHLLFKFQSDAFIANCLLESSGFCCRIGRYGELCINENEDRLMEAGFLLSLLDNLDEWKSQLLVQRENVLLSLLDIPGQSGEERQIGETMRKLLETRLDSVEIDKSGNVLGYKNSKSRRTNTSLTILLSAHLDVCNNTGDGKPIVREGTMLRRDGGILGADDRAGLAMIINCLDMLSQSDICVNVKVALPAEEEVGQIGASKIDESFFEGVDFGISLDRHGTNDIVYKSKSQDYCEKSKAELFKGFSRQLWGKDAEIYKPCEGGISDLRVWSALGIPSVNLSIGFNDEHRPYETLNLEAWHRAHDLVFHSIRNLKSALRRLEKRASQSTI